MFSFRLFLNFLTDTAHDYNAYGDRIFPYGRYLRRAPGGLLSPSEKRHSRAMNKPRTSVEWVFGKMKSICPVVKNMNVMKIRLCPVKKVVTSALLLTNFHTCLRGSQVGSYFALSPPTLAAYIQGEIE